MNLTPFGRTGLLDFLHGVSTLGTGQDGKRPRYDILYLCLKPTCRTAIAVPLALAAPYPRQLLRRELLWVQSVLA